MEVKRFKVLGYDLGASSELGRTTHSIAHSF